MRTDQNRKREKGGGRCVRSRRRWFRQATKITLKGKPKGVFPVPAAVVPAGHAAGRTHVDDRGIKTSASLEEVMRVGRDMLAAAEN